MVRANDGERSDLVGRELDSHDVTALQHQRLVVPDDSRWMLGAIDADELETRLVALRDDDLARLPDGGVAGMERPTAECQRVQLVGPRNSSSLGLPSTASRLEAATRSLLVCQPAPNLGTGGAGPYSPCRTRQSGRPR
jgi:hypothetical protein